MTGPPRRTTSIAPRLTPGISPLAQHHDYRSYPSKSKSTLIAMFTYVLRSLGLYELLYNQWAGVMEIIRKIILPLDYYLCNNNQLRVFTFFYLK